MSKNGGFVMTNKKLDVLNYLQKNSTWKTAAEISSALGYSVRRIKFMN